MRNKKHELIVRSCLEGKANFQFAEMGYTLVDIEC